MTRTSVILAATLLATWACPTAAMQVDSVAAPGLDFQNAPLDIVVSALAEAGGLNIVFGQLPDQRVTLRLAALPSRDETIELLRAVSESNGLEIDVSSDLVVIRASAPEPEPSVADLESGPQGVYVYSLRHTRAPALAETLRALFGAPRGGVDQVSGGADVAAEQGRDLFALGVDMVQDLPQALPGELSGDIQIIADVATNSILVRARPADWEVLETSLQALDQRPLQVLIEMLIVEVRRDATLQVGLSVQTTKPIPLGGGAGTAEGALTSAGGGDVLVSVKDLGGLDLDAALSLLSANGQVRILSRPVILAQNNLQSSILIGSERPFVQVTRTLPTEAAVRDQIVQYRDIGTALSITPTIYPDGYVNLDVVQEISSATSEVQFGAPVISTREAQAQLFARVGQTVVLGGLIDEQIVRSRSGVPLLKDIPLLGYLFGSTRNDRVQSELFLFLTAHLVESDEDVERLLDTLRGAMEMIPELPLPIFQGDDGTEIEVPSVQPLAPGRDPGGRGPSGSGR